jgi:hypothetical protein
MIEGQRPRPVAGVVDDGRPGVVPALGPARGPGQKDRRDGVEPGIARGVRIGAELADELDIERGLLPRLAHGGRLERFAVVDESPGQGPAGRRVFPLDENDAAASSPLLDLDNDVDGRERVAGLAAGHLADRPSEVIVGAGVGSCQFRVQGRRGRPGDCPSMRTLGPRPRTLGDEVSRGSRRGHWHENC